MKRTRERALARAGFARDQERCIRPRDAIDHGKHSLHRRASSDQPFDRELLPHRAPERRGFAAECSLGERALDEHQELFGLERLCEVVIRAAADRLDRGINGAVRRHHDHRDVAVATPSCFEQREAIELRHPQIGHEQVDIILLDRGECGTTRAQRPRDVASVAKTIGESLGERDLIVDDKDALRVRHRSVPWGS
jgi:hypothetical protein